MNVKEMNKAAKDNILFNYRTVDIHLGGSDLRDFGMSNFGDGIDWTLKHLWNKVEDKLPEDTRVYFIVEKWDNGQYNVTTAFYSTLLKAFLARNSTGARYDDVVLWMDIPQYERV